MTVCYELVWAGLVHPLAWVYIGGNGLSKALIKHSEAKIIRTLRPIVRINQKRNPNHPHCLGSFSRSFLLSVFGLII